jgi:hypothetical protein
MVLNKNISYHKTGEKLPLAIFILGLLISELIYTFVDLKIGITLYSILLGCLLLFLAFAKLEQNTNHLFTILILMPLTRLVGSAMPVAMLNFYSRISLVYVILFLAAFSIFYIMPLNFSDLGYRLRGLEYLPGAVILAAFLGFIEFNILKPERLVDSLTLLTALEGFLVTVVFTGFVEELIFRGLLQNTMALRFNITFTLLLSNVIFATMHIVWGQPLEILFVFAVGLLLGIIFWKTKNLILVSFIHGMLNFCLFVIYPIIF